VSYKVKHLNFFKKHTYIENIEKLISKDTLGSIMFQISLKFCWKEKVEFYLIQNSSFYKILLHFFFSRDISVHRAF
jgi:uncharacterized membrane protein